MIFVTLHFYETQSGTQFCGQIKEMTLGKRTKMKKQ